MKYITRNGEAFELPPTHSRTMSVILVFVLAAGVGIGLRLFAESYPEIIVSIGSTCADVFTAVWHMLCDIADAVF